MEYELGKVEREQGEAETAERRVTPAFDIRNFIQKVVPESRKVEAFEPKVEREQEKVETAG